ncbi:ankyrin-2-like, partial [Eurytemora carolleeae]|uniref:ankyrin-2-like n=1 Tax=Eurytemora carolleeae TaxID=1294199 RepID=UPI000C77DA58
IGVETGDINAVQILLRAGAEPGRVNPVLKTSAVHAAAGQARPDMLKALVDYSGPECMNVLDRSGRIPLHLAVLACKKNPDKGLQCVKMCIDHGSNINCLDRKGGQTPLYLAASEQCLPVLKLLLEQGADASIPCQGMSTRQLITDSFSAAEVDQLDLSSVTESSENSFDELLRLVDIAELDGPDDPTFRKALNKASIREVDSSGGSVKKSLVQLCAERGLDSYLKLILEKGGDPNTTTPSESATPLILAAKSGFGENNLLVNGSGEASRLKRGSRVDVYRTDSTGSTVLHIVLRKPFYALDTR